MNRYQRGFKREGKWYYRGESGKAIPIKTGAKRYGEMAKDPAQRPSVPSQYLSPGQRRQREMNARLNTPVGAGTNVTNRDVAREARSDAQVRYGQAESDLRQAMAQQQARQNMVPSYMDQYRQELAQAQQRTQQAYAQAQATIQGLGAGLAGAPPDPSDQAAVQREAQAQAIRQQGTVGTASLLTAQGANTSARFDSDIANVGLRLVEELTREAGKRGDLERQQRDLSREKGEYTSSQRAKLSDSYRKSGLENLAFGADQAQAAAKLKADQQKSDNTVNQWGYTNREWLSMTVAQRERIMRQQKKDGRAPKGPRETKFGYDAEEWDNMSVAERREAKRKWEAKNGKGGEGGRKDESQANRNWRATMTNNIADRIRVDAKRRGYNLKDRKQRASYVALLRKNSSTKDWFQTPYGDALVSGGLDWATYTRLSGGTVRRLRQAGLYVTKAGGYGGPGTGE